MKYLNMFRKVLYLWANNSQSTISRFFKSSSGPKNAFVTIQDVFVFLLLLLFAFALLTFVLMEQK